MIHVPPTIFLSLGIGAAGIWLFARDVRAFPACARSATTDIGRSLVRLERWKFGSLGVGLVLGLAAAEATMRGAPPVLRYSLFLLLAVAVLIGFVASVMSGWLEGRSASRAGRDEPG